MLAIHQWIHLDKLWKLLEAFFLNFVLVFELDYWPKTEKYPNEYQGMNRDQSAMCFISMDSS